ncbi:MAG: TolC family protein [Alphaproteobacteria bacterium]
MSGWLQLVGLIAGLVLLAAVYPVPANAQNRPASADGSSIRSLDQAIALALAQSPALRAAEARRDASRGERRQAGMRPNPELAVEGENFAGSGPYRGVRSLEATVGVGQRIELGGKWTARVSVADAGIAVSESEYQAARLDVIRDVTKAYAEAVAARRAIEVEAERMRLADEVLRVVRARVEGGKEPLVQVRRAEITRSRATLAIEKARREAEIARRSLATLLGVERVEIAPDNAWFEAIGPAPAGRQPIGADAVAANPDLARWEAQIARSRAGLEVEKAGAVPDVTVGAAARRFQDTRDSAVVVTLSVPIPVLNRNQGAIERAGSELVRTEVEARQARLTLEASVADAEERLITAWREADTLRRTVLPAARQAFGFAREGYQAGKFAFLDVLEAERTLFDTRAQLNDALKEVHARRADLNRLTGRFASGAIGGAR